MSEHDQIEIVAGNEVGGEISKITQPSKQAVDGLSSLTDRLSDTGVSDLIPGGLTGDQLLSKSLRCRLEELGGSILDLIEDGFGLTDILNGFEMPSLSELGEKLKQLNPMNLLEKLGDISLESITAKVGELVEGAVDMIADVVSKTFEQIERVIKGVGDMFDEFGDAIQNVGELVDDVVTGIIGGVGEVLQDLAKPIEDIVDALFAPCDKKTQSASNAEEQKLLEYKQMLDTDMENVVGNNVVANQQAQTTGKFSKIIKNTALETVNNSVNQDKLSFNVPGEHAADTTDAKQANQNENKKRREAETAAVSESSSSLTSALTNAAVEQRDSEDVEFTKDRHANESDEAGELTSGVFSEDECQEVFNRFSLRIGKIVSHISKSLENHKNLEGNIITLLRDLTDIHTSYPEVIKEVVVVYYENDRMDIAMMPDPRMTAYRFNEKMDKKEQIDSWEHITKNISILSPKNIDYLAKVIELTDDLEVIQQVRKCDEMQADKYLAASDEGYESQWGPHLIRFEEINKYVQSGKQEDIINPGVDNNVVKRITTGGAVYNLIKGGSGNVVEFNKSADIINTVNEQK